jgi:hypothetical protein
MTIKFKQARFALCKIEYQKKYGVSGNEVYDNGHDCEKSPYPPSNRVPLRRFNLWIIQNNYAQVI